MPDLLTTLAFIIGLLSGLISAVPVGPINVTILNEGGRRGFLWAFMIGLGATAMEFLYCAAGFAGFSRLFTSPWVEATLQAISVLLLLFLGIKYLRLHDVPHEGRAERVVEEKLHPHTAFMTGFLRALANPGVLLFWIVASSVFLAHGWIEDSWQGKAACVLGVTAGLFLWFTALSYAATHAHRRLSTNGLVRLSQGSGVVLLLVAVGLTIRLILLLVRR
jgi:threonine/homoserine/homoserine lactone efflux protein